MGKRRTVLAIIPARGGSKGLPRKNVRNLAGKPLIAWTIEAAKKSKFIDRLILSSEDAEIIEAAKQWGCEAPFVRPVALAQDETPGIDVVLHAIEEVAEYDYILLLQPTSPLRTTKDIDECIKHCLKQKANSCVSLVQSQKSPYWMFQVDKNGKMKPLLTKGPTYSRRQDLPAVYAINGALYFAKREWLLKKKTFFTKETIAHIMPPERSLDVDSELDLMICDLLLRERKV